MAWNKISQQPENCENRNDPDLVQAFLKKWRVESDFKAPNLPLSWRLKVSGLLFSANSVIFQLYHGGKSNFQWDDDEVRFVLDKHS
jgi:hypothetical protein